jgi:hypothetical protein
MRGLYLFPEAEARKSYDAAAHKEWLDWCTQVEESAKQLAQLAEKAWYKTGPSQVSYITMMLGPFAALEELRQQLCRRCSS